MPPTPRPTDDPPRASVVVEPPDPTEGEGPLPRPLAGVLGQIAAAAERLGRGALFPATGVARGLLGSGAAALRGRLPTVDLEERDSYLLRDLLPIAWLISSIWFRAEVRGLHHVPRRGPVLFVGNHSGGNATPDTFVFALAFASHFGPERPLHMLIQNQVATYPGMGLLRRLGAVPARPEVAREALAAGGSVLLYPNGEREAHRPSWESGRIDLGGRDAFVRIAVDADVPIVPLVGIGGQETALFLDRGEGLARVLGLDRALAGGGLPISLALPWILNVGDVLGHIPLPAKIVLQALAPIDVRERFGPDPDPAEVAAYVSATMQEMLDELGRRRRLPVVG